MPVCVSVGDVVVWGGRGWVRMRLCVRVPYGLDGH